MLGSVSLFLAAGFLPEAEVQQRCKEKYVGFVLFVGACVDLLPATCWSPKEPKKSRVDLGFRPKTRRVLVRMLRIFSGLRLKGLFEPGGASSVSLCAPVGASAWGMREVSIGRPGGWYLPVRGKGNPKGIDLVRLSQSSLFGPVQRKSNPPRKAPALRSCEVSCRFLGLVFDLGVGFNEKWWLRRCCQKCAGWSFKQNPQGKALALCHSWIRYPPFEAGLQISQSVSS